MAKRTISSGLLILAIAIAAVASTARSSVAQRAEDECLSKPNGAPTQGMHWWYRTDRVNNRRCWYLGPPREQAAQAGQDAAAKPAQAGQSARPAQAAQDAPRPRRVAKPVARPANEPSDTPVEEPSETAARPIESPQAGPAPWSEQPASAPAPTLLASVAAAPATTGIEQPTDEQPTSPQATTADEEMPLIWPVLTEAELAAPDISQARGASMLAVIAGLLALVAVFGHRLFKLFAARRLRDRRFAPDDQPNEAALPAPARDRVAPALASATAVARPAAAASSAGRVTPAMPTLRRSPSIVAKADADDIEAELQWLRRERRRQVA